MRPYVPLVALALALSNLSGCGSGAGEDPQTKKGSKSRETLLVRVVHPQLRDLDATLPMTAKGLALEEAKVMPRIAGVRVLTVLKDVGDAVSKDEPLATLETVELEHAVEESDAALAEARVRVSDADLALKEAQAEILAQQTTIARKVQIFERLKMEGRGVAQDEVDAARYELDKENAQTARLKLRERQAQVAKTLAGHAVTRAELTRKKALRERECATVRAPIDGIISARQAATGAMATQATLLFEMYDPKSMVVETRLPQQHLSNVREGQTVKFESDVFPGVTFLAQVANIAPVVDREIGVVAVRLRFDTAGTYAFPANQEILQREDHQVLVSRLREGRALKPGMHVAGNIVLETRKGVLTIPRKAVGYMRGQPFIYVVEPAESETKGDGNGESPKTEGYRVRRLYFREGLPDEGSVQFIPLSGQGLLKPTDQVVLVGQDRLRDGDPVRLEEADPPSKPANGKN